MIKVSLIVMCMIINCGCTKVKFSPPTNVVVELLDTSATLTWDANTETNLAGYKVYHSIVPNTFTIEPPIDVGLVTTYKFINLAAGTTHYFTVSAYDTEGNESAFAIQVSKFIGVKP